MRSTNKFLSLFLVSLLVFAPFAHANDVWTNAQSDQYGKKFGGMLGRGLINIVSSPVDLVVHTVEKTKSEPPVVGTLSGLGSGIGCTVLRLGSGALDVVTSWVPNFNGAPVSKSYSNCLEKETYMASRSTTAYTSSVASPSTTSWTSSTPTTSSSSWTSSTPTSSSNWEGSSTTTSSSGWTTATPSTTTTSTNMYVDKAGSSVNKYVDKAGTSSSSAYKKTTHDPYKYVKK